MKQKVFIQRVVASLMLAAGIGANAATLHVVGGQLVGADNVLVDGGLYDVAFVDGSCIALFSGCDNLSDFAFQTSTSAVNASQALLDQVFLDGVEGLFDTAVDLTAGCVDPRNCIALTPYALFPNLPGGPSVALGLAVNTLLVDEVFVGGTLPVNSSTQLENQTTYAIWTPAKVPVPAAVWLFSSALLVSVGVKRGHL